MYIQVSKSPDKILDFPQLSNSIHRRYKYFSEYKVQYRAASNDINIQRDTRIMKLFYVGHDVPLVGSIIFIEN